MLNTKCTAQQLLLGLKGGYACSPPIRYCQEKFIGEEKEPSSGRVLLLALPVWSLLPLRFSMLGVIVHMKWMQQVNDASWSDKHTVSRIHSPNQQQQRQRTSY